MGDGWVLMVTTWGEQLLVVRVTTVRARLTCRPDDTRATCRPRTGLLVFVCRYCLTCAGGVSATCTAPPPMIAPPQVQAHNFAKAIRTDIVFSFSDQEAWLRPSIHNRGRVSVPICKASQNKALISIPLTLI